MIAYLDTHILVWLAQGAVSRLSKAARKMLEEADLLISPMALIELEYLYELKRSKLPSRDLHLKVEHETGARVCNLSFGTVANISIDEKWTRDPFDRVIVAQAKANGLAFLISADDDVRKHYPRTIW